MELNPLAMLEVTMEPERPEEDDECMIIEPDPPPTMNLDPDSQMVVMPQPEEEATFYQSGFGCHFLQSMEQDPLASPADTITNGYLPGQANLPALPDPLPKPRPLQSTSLVSRNKKSLSLYTQEEHEYRVVQYPNLEDVLNEDLHCTICREHVGCDTRCDATNNLHPLLKVLVCVKCAFGYKKITFNIRGGKDVRCRWCGLFPGRPTTGSLIHCSQCPFAFCQSCLQVNLKLSITPSTKGWKCLACNPKLIWQHRSRIWAMRALKSKLLREKSGLMGKDLAACAKKCTRKVPLLLGKRPPLLNKPPDPLPHSVKRTVNGTSHVATSGSLLKNMLEPPRSEIEYFTVYQKKMPTDWLLSKIVSYETDILNMLDRIKDVKTEILPEDTVESIWKKVENLSTQLTLNSSLLKDCSINLKNEWNERKLRYRLEEKPTSLKLIKVQRVVKLSPTQEQKSVNCEIPVIDLDEEELPEGLHGPHQLRIKPCSVRLKKLPYNLVRKLRRFPRPMSEILLDLQKASWGPELS